MNQFDQQRKEKIIEKSIEICAISFFVTSIILLIVSFFTDKIDGFTIVITAPIQVAAIFMTKGWQIE